MLFLYFLAGTSEERSKRKAGWRFLCIVRGASRSHRSSDWLLGEENIENSGIPFFFSSFVRCILLLLSVFCPELTILKCLVHQKDTF